MIFLKLYFAFFKIGALAFGGGLAVVQLIYDNIQTFVAISPQKFADIVAVAQVTPGPIAINTATYIGYETAGYAGALVATAGVATPAFIIIAIVARAVSKYRNNIYLNGALDTIRPATVGMIGAAAITVGRPAILTHNVLGSNIGAISGLLGSLPQGIDFIAVIICLLTIILVGKIKIGPIKVLIIMGCIGAVLGV
jgi:chromate transporter